MDVTIRTAVASDIQAIMDTSKSLLRKIGFDETRTWLHVDPEGIFLAETNEFQIVGTCCAIRLSPDEGFVGLFWVAEGFRCQGLGTKLGRRAMTHLGDRNVAFRATKALGDVYSERYGFTYVGDKILIYEFKGQMLLPERRSGCGVGVATFVEGQLVKIGSGQGDETVASGTGTFTNGDVISEVEACDKSLRRVDATAVEGQLMKIQSGQGTDDESDASDTGTLATADIISKVEAYDKSLRNVDLSVVIREMFFWRSCKISVAMASGKVVGFGCLRPVVTGHWVVSPLYADTVSVAETILLDLFDGFDFSLPSEGIWFRFPEKNTDCIRLLKRFGFRDVSFDFGTRFNKRLANQDTSKIYSYYSVTFCTE